MTEEYIFYGAGSHSKKVMKSMLNIGISPVCFADQDEMKHYTIIETPFYEGKQGDIKVLPLEDAMKRYPNAKLYITVGPTLYTEVYDYLLVKNVPPARIKGPSLHCILIGNYITITDGHIYTCPDKRVPVELPRSGDIKKDTVAYSQLCKRLADDLNEGKSFACAGCQLLRAGCAVEMQEMKILNFALTGVCNFNCCYCIYEPDADVSGEVYEMLSHFDKEENIELVLLTTGELTISKYRDEILAYLKNSSMRGLLFTNASIYLDEISNLMREKGLVLNISLDAGTRETYARVKNSDCFDTVLQNIEKYVASGGAYQVCLKYVVLDGVNCEDRDIESFVKIAAKLKTDVLISHDMFSSFSPESESVFTAVSKFARLCIENDIPYMFSFLDKYYDRLRLEGLLDNKLRFLFDDYISGKLSSKNN